MQNGNAIEAIDRISGNLLNGLGPTLRLLVKRGATLKAHLVTWLWKWFVACIGDAKKGERFDYIL